MPSLNDMVLLKPKFLIDTLLTHHTGSYGLLKLGQFQIMSSYKRGW